MLPRSEAAIATRATSHGKSYSSDCYITRVNFYPFGAVLARARIISQSRDGRVSRKSWIIISRAVALFGIQYSAREAYFTSSRTEPEFHLRVESREDKFSYYPHVVHISN